MEVRKVFRKRFELSERLGDVGLGGGMRLPTFGLCCDCFAGGLEYICKQV